MLVKKNHIKLILYLRGITKTPAKQKPYFI